MVRVVKISRIIASVVLAAYLFVPFVDTVACEDCIHSVEAALHQAVCHHASSFLRPTVKVSQMKSFGETQAGQTDFCQVCFGTAKIVNTEHVDVPFAPVLFRFCFPRMTTPLLAYTLIKPPEL